MNVSATADVHAARIRRLVNGIDLADPDNLRPIIRAIEETFSGREGGDVLTSFLVTVDAGTAQRPLPTRGPTPEEEAEMRRREELFQPRRRGPYGHRTPGILWPELAQGARILVPPVEAIGGALAGGGAFVSGLLSGISGSISAADREQLATRLWQSTILNAVFPPVFVAGAVVGIVDDIVDAVKGIYRMITDFAGFLREMRALLGALFGPEGREVARALGVEIGRDYGTRIATLARDNVFGFTYGVGKMIGPTIVYTVLGLLGVPELLMSAVVARLMAILRPLLARFPRLLRIVEVVASRLGRTGTHTSHAELEADLDRSFAATFDQAHTHGRAGPPTPVAPEIRAGFQPSHLGPLRRMFGRPLNSPEIADVGRVWASVANPGDAASLTLSNSRRLFDNQRGRFWRAVRGDPAARRIFEDAGFSFGSGPTTAPTRTLSDGSIMQATIDHVVERQTAPGRALDPANLRISTRRENTVLLRQLHDQDPFLQVHPGPPAAVPAVP